MKLPPSPVSFADKPRNLSLMPRTETLIPGSNVTCSADANPPAHITLYTDPTSDSFWSGLRANGRGSAVLVIPPNAPAGNVTVVCKAKNTIGEAKSKRRTVKIEKSA